MRMKCDGLFRWLSCTGLASCLWWWLAGWRTFRSEIEKCVHLWDASNIRYIEVIFSFVQRDRHPIRSKWLTFEHIMDRLTWTDARIQLSEIKKTAKNWFRLYNWVKERRPVAGVIDFKSYVHKFHSHDQSNRQREKVQKKLKEKKQRICNCRL